MSLSGGEAGGGAGATDDDASPASDGSPKTIVSTNAEYERQVNIEVLGDNNLFLHANYGDTNLLATGIRVCIR